MGQLIRVLQVVGNMSQGGIESALMNVYRKIDKRKIQFDFVVHGKGVYDDEIRQMGGKVYYLPRLTSPFSFLKWQKEFMTLLNEVKPLVVQSHVGYKSRMALSCAKKAGVPMRVAHSHGDIPLSVYLKSPKNILLKLIFSLFWRLDATDYWAITKRAGIQQFGKKIVNSSLFHVVKLAIDCERFMFNSFERDKIRKEFHIHDDAFVMGHIGRMDKVQKNQSFLLDVFIAFQKLSFSHVHMGARLMLVGDGVMRKTLEEKAVTMGIADRVIFTGNRFDTECLLSAMDYFIMPSIFEGLPVTSVEAQASGLPCLLSSTINNEAKIVPTLGFESLKKSPQQWAERIAIPHIFEERIVQNRLVKKAGWDINDLVIWLETEYLNGRH